MTTLNCCTKQIIISNGAKKQARLPKKLLFLKLSGLEVDRLETLNSVLSSIVELHSNFSNYIVLRGVNGTKYIILLDIQQETLKKSPKKVLLCARGKFLSCRARVALALRKWVCVSVFRFICNFWTNFLGAVAGCRFHNNVISSSKSGAVFSRSGAALWIFIKAHNCLLGGTAVIDEKLMFKSHLLQAETTPPAEKEKLKKLGRNRRSPLLFNKKTVNCKKITPLYFISFPTPLMHFRPTCAHAAKFNMLPALYWYHNLADDSNAVMTVTERRELIAVLYLSVAAYANCRAYLTSGPAYIRCFFFRLQPQVTSHDSARFARSETVNLTRLLPGIRIYCVPGGRKLLWSRYIFMGNYCLLEHQPSRDNERNTENCFHNWYWFVSRLRMEITIDQCISKLRLYFRLKCSKIAVDFISRK